MENEKQLTHEERLEKVSQIFDKSIRNLRDALELKEKALEIKERAIKEREDLFKQKEEQSERTMRIKELNALKSLATAMTGEHEHLGFAMAPDSISSERIYDKDELIEIKGAIQKIIKEF